MSDDGWKRLIYKDIQDLSTRLIPTVDQVPMPPYSWVAGRIRLDLMMVAPEPDPKEVRTWWR